MKIIQHGDPVKLERLAATKTFRCGNCGCIFEADWREYDETCIHEKKTLVSCDCPDCHLIAFEKETGAL